MKPKLISGALYLSCVLLLLTASAKIWSAFGTGKHELLLTSRDPLLGISNQAMMLLAGGYELVAAVSVLVFVKRKWLPSFLIGFIGIQILAYRLFLAFQGIPRACPCLGSLGDRIPIDQTRLDHLLVGVALWFAISGTLAFIYSYPWKNSTGSSPVPPENLFPDGAKN